MDLSGLKPLIAAEGQKLVDSVLIPELEKIIKEKVSDPVLQVIALSLVPVLKAAADQELAQLAQ